MKTCNQKKMTPFECTFNGQLFTSNTQKNIEKVLTITKQLKVTFNQLTSEYLVKISSKVNVLKSQSLTAYAATNTNLLPLS